MKKIVQVAYVLRCKKCLSFFDAAEFAGAIQFPNKKDAVKKFNSARTCTDCGEGEYEVKKAGIIDD